MKKLLSIFLGIILCSVFIVHAKKQVWTNIKANYLIADTMPGFVPKADSIRYFTIGFDNFVADLYWIRAVQYSGANARRSEFQALYEYLDLITGLDPHFEAPYINGALLLPTVHQGDKAIELLEKGRKANPESWRMVWQQAFVEYFYLGNTEKAISLYEQCALVSDCPEGAQSIVDALKRGESKYTIAKNEWRRVFKDENSSEDDKNFALLKFEEASNLVVLNKLKRDYIEKYGEMPYGLDDLKKENPETEEKVFNSPFEGINFWVDRDSGYVRSSNE